MLKKVDCKSCTPTHFDHYECSDCSYSFGFVNPHFNFCPNCGGKLTKRAVDLRQRVTAVDVALKSVVRGSGASR